jgi:hypothetical protein
LPRDIAGTYELPLGDVASGTVIASSWANTTLDDLAFAMTDSLSRTGSGGMLTALPLSNGSATNPSLTFVNNLTTGRYLFAPGDMRDTVDGVDLIRYNNGDVTLWADPNWISIFQNAAEVSYDNSTSGLAAATVQAAIDELEGEKVAKAGDTMTGNLTTKGVTCSWLQTNEGNVYLGFDGSPTPGTATDGFYVARQEGFSALTNKFVGAGPDRGITVTRIEHNSVPHIECYDDNVTALRWGETDSRLETSATGGEMFLDWTAVTQAPGDNSTKLATTAYVIANAEIKANSNGVYRQLGDGTIEQWGVTTTDGGPSVTSALLPVAVTSKVIAICSASSHNPNSSTSSKAGATLDGAANIIEVFTDSTLSAGVMWYLLGTL